MERGSRPAALRNFGQRRGLDSLTVSALAADGEAGDGRAVVVVIAEVDEAETLRFAGLALVGDVADMSLPKGMASSLSCASVFASHQTLQFSR